MNRKGKRIVTAVAAAAVLLSIFFIYRWRDDDRNQLAAEGDLATERALGRLVDMGYGDMPVARFNEAAVAELEGAELMQTLMDGKLETSVPEQRELIRTGLDILAEELTYREDGRHWLMNHFTYYIPPEAGEDDEVLQVICHLGYVYTDAAAVTVDERNAYLDLLYSEYDALVRDIAPEELDTADLPAMFNEKARGLVEENGHDVIWAMFNVYECNWIERHWTET